MESKNGYVTIVVPRQVPSGYLCHFDVDDNTRLYCDNLSKTAAKQFKCGLFRTIVTSERLKSRGLSKGDIIIYKCANCCRSVDIATAEIKKRSEEKKRLLFEAMAEGTVDDFFARHGEKNES